MEAAGRAGRRSQCRKEGHHFSKIDELVESVGKLDLFQNQVSLGATRTETVPVKGEGGNKRGWHSTGERSVKREVRPPFSCMCARVLSSEI